MIDIFFRLASRRPSLAALCSTLLLGSLASSSVLAQLRPSPSLNLPRASQDTSQRSADFIVAIVNSEPVTNQQVRSRMLQVEQQLSAQGGAMPSRQELASQVLERIISERAQIQHARESGIRVDAPAVDGMIENIARQNQLSSAQLRERLRADGMDFATFRNNITEQLLLQRVRERDVEPRVRISEADLDQFIREQRQSPTANEVELNLAQVLIVVPENATEAQIAPLLAKAQRAFDRARTGEDFAAIAREMSDGTDRANGGEFGLRPADRYPSLFLEATQNLAVGQVAAPIRSGAGFHVLKLLEKKQQGFENLSVVQTRARHILLRTGPQLTESTARERLVQLRQRIVGGLDFAQAARDNSQDGSAREGGDLGWASPGQFVPEFEEVMNALAPGQVSAPVVTRFGVHLLQVQERRERKLNEREQRAAAREALRERKLDEAFVTWAQDLRARAYVEMREPPQ